MKRLTLVFMAFFFSCNRVNEPVENPVADFTGSYQDVAFAQEYHEGFTIDPEIPEANDVRAIYSDSKNSVWVATKNGVYKKSTDQSEWKLQITGEHQGPAYDIKEDRDGRIWAATWEGLYAFYENNLTKALGSEAPISKIVVADEGIYALGPKGIWQKSDGSWDKLDTTVARSIRAVVSDAKQGLWIGTDVGLYHVSNGKTTVFNANEDLVSAYIRGIDYDTEGNLWVGGLGGVAIRNDQQKIGEKLPADGVPNAWVNVVKKSPDGTMWVGTNYGIARFKPGSDDYSVRLSKRWLMNDEVRDIAFDSNGNAWIATANGVSAIKTRQMTLKDKADYFYDRLIKRHIREPWIAARYRLAIPGDTTTIEEEDDDNDGEYTSGYLAMESFRYAATGDPEAKERARKAFDFLKLLREVTGSDGFFARTIVPTDWTSMHDPNRTYTPQQLADELVENPRFKPVETRWHLSADGKWKWKGDTSSDEMDGHFFGYYCYYNLVADEPEKQRIADHVSKILDHLVANDFNLVDVDGLPTRWGIWSPKQLNGDPEWSPEKALNSLEILSFLKFGYAITNNQKYQDAYLKLIHEEHYIQNAHKLHNTNPSWETYFDIYLALYIYPALINYEKDTALKAEYVRHMNEWFEKHKITGSPFVNFTYNWLANNSQELDNSVYFLRDTPLDLVDWYIDNGKREDLHLVRSPILEELQTNRLLPPSEYRTIRWDKNPYEAVVGNPSEEKEPVFWLLPYWMGRYLGLIRE